MRNRRSSRRAFTLLELLLVLVILGVLAALVVPRFAGRSEQARITAAQTDVSAIQNALDQFEIDTGRYPSNDEGLGALMTRPGSVENWNGPYLRGNELPKDPWGNAYIYRYPAQNNNTGFDLYSTGPDGREGNDDIGNWE